MYGSGIPIIYAYGCVGKSMAMISNEYVLTNLFSFAVVLYWLTNQVLTSVV